MSCRHQAIANDHASMCRVNTLGTGLIYMATWPNYGSQPHARWLCASVPALMAVRFLGESGLQHASTCTSRLGHTSSLEIMHECMRGTSFLAAAVGTGLIKDPKLVSSATVSTL